MFSKLKRSFIYINEYSPDILNKFYKFKTWKSIILPDNATIFYTNDLNCVIENNLNKWCCCIGTFLNIENFCLDINLIKKDIINCLKESHEKFFDYLDILNGRYAIFYGERERERDVCTKKFVNEETGMRSLWYSTNKKLISSHYALIQYFLNDKTSDFFSLYNSICKELSDKHLTIPWVLPGDLSPYDNIKLLLSNHYLNINTLKTKRFWPRANFAYQNIDDVSYYIAHNIENQISHLSDKYNLIQSITSGNDSRISLSATRKIKNRIIFFSYHNNTNISNKNIKYLSYDTLSAENDFKFALELAKKENLKFISIRNNCEINNDIKNLTNFIHYHHHILGVIPSYIKNFKGNFIHIRSNLIEIIRSIPNEYIFFNKSISLAEKFKSYSMYNNINNEYSNTIINYYKKFIVDQEYENIFNINPGDLFYQEYRCNQWMGGAVLIENDIVFDTFMLFNCRKFFEYSYAIPKQWKKRNVLVSKIINILWPELINNYTFPNKYTSSNSLVDWNISKANSVFLFDKDIYNTYNYVINAGNIFSNKIIPKYFEPRLDGITFGFSNGLVNKGDYVELKFEHKLKENMHYLYEFDIFCYYCSFDFTKDIVYQIYINNKIIYELPLNIYTSKINQVICKFINNDLQTNNICIRIYSSQLKNVEFNSLINIKNIILKEEYDEKLQKNLYYIYSSYKAIKTNNSYTDQISF